MGGGVGAAKKLKNRLAPQLWFVKKNVIVVQLKVFEDMIRIWIKVTGTGTKIWEEVF